MASKEKEYSNGTITIVWKPELCIHSENCINHLPEVYKPSERPWIKIDNATTEEIKKQIPTCPSGALSYYMNDQKQNSPKESSEVKVKALKNGPLLVHGNLEITDAKGNVYQRNHSTAFCRCGQSSNKPFCDGSHARKGFKDQ